MLWVISIIILLVIALVAIAKHMNEVKKKKLPRQRR